MGSKPIHHYNSRMSIQIVSVDKNTFLVRSRLSYTVFLFLKLINVSEAGYKLVKINVLLKNAFYINQRSMLEQLGLFLKMKVLFGKEHLMSILGTFEPLVG